MDSNHFEPPCVVVNGNHYYAPPTQLAAPKYLPKGAVEALKKSVEAATSASKKSSDIVIADGSRSSPRKYPVARHPPNPKVPDARSALKASDKTRPSSSSGPLVPPTSEPVKTSQVGSPRRLSDSTIRPNFSRSPSPKALSVGGSNASGQSTPRIQPQPASSVAGEA